MTEPPYEPFPAFAAWSHLALDDDTFDRYFGLLDALRASSDPDTLARAVETATRAAAVDTAAIEGLYEVDRGFTMTVAVRTAAWESVIASREPVVRRSFEDALRAYDYVLDLATTRTEVTEKAVREIHAGICAGQETYQVVTSAGVQERPLPKGEYKETPNNPTNRRTGKVHAYAAPIEVPAEMQRLVAEFRTERFMPAHPVLQAAYAHYAFVAIHPFADGNGRVARALASVFLYRKPGVPLVIWADQKDAYLDGLEEADAGRPEAFVRFVGDRVVDVVGLVDVSAGAAGRPAAASIASLREAMVGDHGLTYPQQDAVASRLLNAAFDELRSQAQALELPPGVVVDELRSAHRVGADQTHRPVEGIEETVGFAIAVDVPVPMFVQAELGVRVRRGDATGPLFELLDLPRRRPLPVDLREVYPSLTGVLELKIKLWIEDLLATLLTDLDASMRQALQHRSYL